MESKTEKWMERIHLNVSERPFPPHIQLPPEIQESQEVTLTCLLNFSCYGYPIQLQWFLEGVPVGQAAVNSTSLATKSVFTRSELKFSPQWSHHGKIVTCQLHDADGKFLSNDTVQLNVKRESPRHACGKGKICVAFSPGQGLCHLLPRASPGHTALSAPVFQEKDLL
ncbi:CD22 isoform 31 [Pongo abelii]|uniref:CD22 isoform 31 n=1 Tax=Pongo abelii TaxID=9601 RepID=A0A2J8RRE9_PONAB|nr:CD22 isoform 31 [Pongo abelii]